MTRRATASLLVMLLGGLLFAAPALAAQAEPSIISRSWYWETQQNQNIDTPVGTVAGEAPNPFCPSAPGSLGGVPGTCADGRLPVEVISGDYEEPDKVSAVGFDLSMLTPGSTVTKFTVTMLEAESGCHPNEDAQPHGQECEETDARNAEGKLLQACEITEFFGDGEARQYKEMPKFTCSGAATAERKEVKNDDKNDPNDPDPDHIWTFDLTPLAKRWAAAVPLCSCVMFRPAKPKNAEDDSPNWRVVLAGPKYPNGVKTNLVFTPGDDGGLPPITPVTPIGSSDPIGGAPTSSFGSTTVGGGLDSGSSDGDDLGTTGETPGETAAPEEVAAEDPELAAAEGPEIETMPGYVWLALLAGLMGWSMVRSIIMENTKAHRANGVLAHIHRINSARGGMQGAAAAGAVASPLSGLKSGLASVGSAVKPVTSKISSVFGKIPGIKKG